MDLLNRLRTRSTGLRITRLLKKEMLSGVTGWCALEKGLGQGRNSLRSKFCSNQLTLGEGCGHNHLGREYASGMRLVQA